LYDSAAIIFFFWAKNFAQYFEFCARQPTPPTPDIKTIFVVLVGRDDADSEDLSPTTAGELERREQPQQPGGGGVTDVAGRQTNEKSLHGSPLDACAKEVRHIILARGSYESWGDKST